MRFFFDLEAVAQFLLYAAVAVGVVFALGLHKNIEFLRTDWANNGLVTVIVLCLLGFLVVKVFISMAANMLFKTFEWILILSVGVLYLFGYLGNTPFADVEATYIGVDNPKEKITVYNEGNLSSKRTVVFSAPRLWVMRNTTELDGKSADSLLSTIFGHRFMPANVTYKGKTYRLFWKKDEEQPQ